MDLSDSAQAASAYDQMQLVAALQGIVNRDAPRLYVNFSQPNPYFDGYPDEYWLAQLQRSGGMLAGRSLVPVADLDSLIKMFRPFVRGSVVWDPKVWSTANVATTVAGVEDVLPIRYDPSPGSLYSRYVAPTVPPGSTPAPPSGHVPPGTPPALPPGRPPAIPPAVPVPPDQSPAPSPGHAPLGPPAVAPGYIKRHDVSSDTSPPTRPGPPPEAKDRLPAQVWLVGRGGSSLFTGSGVIPGTDLASSGSAKCDAYLWAKVKYLDTRRCDASQLGYYLDAYWLVDPNVGGLAATCVTNHDYLVSKRGFLFDLSPWMDEEPPDSAHEPLGADVKTLEAILLSAYRGTGGEMTVINGFVPWQYKYTNLSKPVPGSNGAVAAEWQFVEIASLYNAYLDADAPAIGNMANASVFSHVPLQGAFSQPTSPGVAELQRRGLVNADGAVVPRRYLMFYAGDFDSAAWMYNTLPGLWNDPSRGSVPINWAFDPELSNRIAPAFLYTRATATGNDFFIAGDSGAGYLNPSALEAPRAISGLPSGLAAWQRHCSRYYQLWDISITGFVIDGNTPAMSARGRQSYAQFSYNGFAEQYTSELGIVGTTPYLQMPSGVGGTPAQVAGQIGAMLYGDTSQAPYVPEWHSIRAVLQTPTWYRQVSEQMQADFPSAEVVFLDAFTFYALIRQYLEDQVIVMVSGSERGVVAGRSVPVLLELDNYRGQATTGTVTVAGPSGWSASPSSVPFSLQSDQSEPVWVDVTAPAGLTLGEGQEVKAVVSFAGTTRSYGFEAVSFPSLTAVRATSVPPLDGTVTGQWETAESITVTPDNRIVKRFGFVWDVPPQGGAVSALWDAEHLYVLAQINDDNVMAPATTAAEGAPWLDDGVVIYLSYGPWAFKLAATVPTASGSSLVYYYPGTYVTTNVAGGPDPSAAEVGYLKTSNGYNLAFAIPWTKLEGFTAQAGMALRFTPLVLDRQGASPSEWGQVMWCGDDDNPQINGFLLLNE